MQQLPVVAGRVLGFGGQGQELALVLGEHDVPGGRSQLAEIAQGGVRGGAEAGGELVQQPGAHRLFSTDRLDHGVDVLGGDVHPAHPTGEQHQLLHLEPVHEQRGELSEPPEDVAQLTELVVEIRIDGSVVALMVCNEGHVGPSVQAPPR